jgi:hypothetical protein
VGSDVSPASGAVGLIGLGEIGQVHASAIQRSRTARLVAVADAVTAGREPPVTGAAALETISLLQRIYDTAVVLHGPAPGPRSPG